VLAAAAGRVVYGGAAERRLWAVPPGGRSYQFGDWAARSRYVTDSMSA
jgi:hypothetical protein